MVADRLTIAQYGAGAIGSAIARLVVQRDDLRLVAVIDSDPTKHDTDAGKVLGLTQELGFNVSSDDQVLNTVAPNIVLHSTSSSLRAVLPQLRAAIDAGADVISTCEELSYPYANQPEVAAVLSDAAVAANVSVLGTGVNPGFIMDTLPALLSAVCENVDTITVTRVVDTSLRRRQLQLKTGLGLSADEFALRARAGSVRHVGLLESAQLLVAALGWKADRFDDRIEPVLATQPLQTEGGVIPPGAVRGVHQLVSAQIAGKVRLELDLWMAFAVDNPRDEVRIEGSPSLHMLMPNGVFGDSATAGIVVNAVHSIREARPGLVTMLDLPLVRARLGQPVE